MSQQSRLDLLARVKKLLALSTSSNLHEAASAAAAAQRLIARHNLDALVAAESDNDDDDPISDGREAPLEVAKRPRRWRFALADGLAHENGGAAWSLERADRSVALCFCGRQSDRDNVALLFSTLAVRIEWLSASAGQNRPRQWHEAFRVGAVDAIVARMAAGDVDGVDADASMAHALVVAEPRLAARRARVERFIETHLRLGSGRSFSVDARAFSAGRSAGAALSLSPAPTKKASPKKASPS